MIAAALRGDQLPLRIAFRGPLCEDVRATMRCLCALGAGIREKKGELAVTPIHQAPHQKAPHQKVPHQKVSQREVSQREVSHREVSHREVSQREAPHREVLRCGQSAATLRFLLPVAAAVKPEEGEIVFLCDAQLAQRPLAPLLRALEAHGVEVIREATSICLRDRLRGGSFTLPGDVSSQFFSGLCFALPLLAEGGELRAAGALQSGGFFEMTRDMLRLFCAETWEQNGITRIPGGQAYTTPAPVAATPAATPTATAPAAALPPPAVATLRAEGAWDCAAQFLVAGALGGPVEVRGLEMASLQPDREILAHLRAFGAMVEQGESRVTVSQGALRGITADVSPAPDLAPLLAVLGAFARGETCLRGISRLRGKESDRAEAILSLLRWIGAPAGIEGDCLRIAGAGSHPASLAGAAGGSLLCPPDHRMVMAAAIAASALEGIAGGRRPHARGAGSRVPHSACVAKSYPLFFEDFRSLGGIAYEQ